MAVAVGGPCHGRDGCVRLACWWASYSGSMPARVAESPKVALQRFLGVAGCVIASEQGEAGGLGSSRLPCRGSMHGSLIYQCEFKGAGLCLLGVQC